MAAARPTPSAPFVSRELNGELLLDELADLRNAQVSQKQLDDLARALRTLEGARVSEAVGQLKALAANRFAGQPALGALLVRWSAKLKSELDVPLLAAHLERLALVSAMLSAMRRGADRFPRGGR
ncbi:MAG: hypothetical protein INH41_17030 [Myxococcaceae bacterium]|jgi:hypothetical protein|nr:hypothetical protein [Myxococcaceae bacterium]